MLRMMRHHAKYFYVLFVVVILSFIFWGVGTVDKGEKRNVIAEVDKFKISYDEYDRAYYNAYQFYRDIYKEKFDDEMQKKLNLKEIVLNSLINNRILLIAAQKNGLTVSNEELNEAVTNEPAFMRDGVFDETIYQNRLKLMRLTPEGFELLKREELLIAKIRRMIELSAAEPEISLPPNMKADDQTLKSLKETVLNNAKDQTIKAYIEGLKKGMKITINKDLIS